MDTFRHIANPEETRCGAGNRDRAVRRGICTFCWVRIHDLKSTQARHGSFPCSKPCGAGAEAEAGAGVGAEAAASLCPVPRPRASVTKSSVISERAPRGRKEKALLRGKPVGSLGAAILPAD